MSGASAVFELSRAVDRTPAGSDERLDALVALARHPCARHTVAVTEVWTEISEIHRRRGDWDDAIDAWEQAIRLGYRSAPHPRAEIAELNILAGRRDIGDAIYRDLRDRYPDDVWLYNSAGLTYLDVGDHATALAWIDDALELTMSDGDQVGLVGQLSDMRDRALRALGRDTRDDLAGRIEAFVPSPRSWTSRLDQTRGEAEPSMEPCPQCGAAPDHVRWIPTGTDWPSTTSTRNGHGSPASSAKVPRNSPCPCGSGKKAKHCCNR
ncbi:MAG: SEC-C metal-binding domain-containing protein [Acidimicrobiales bacterium]|jgi:tetratricopeptide (TPR) repeat protein|nr:SEC-C domain-containing protein [Microthrixaceae bacterium]